MVYLGFMLAAVLAVNGEEWRYAGSLYPERTVFWPSQQERPSYGECKAHCAADVNCGGVIVSPRLVIGTQFGDYTWTEESVPLRYGYKAIQWCKMEPQDHIPVICMQVSKTMAANTGKGHSFGFAKPGAPANDRSIQAQFLDSYANKGKCNKPACQIAGPRATCPAEPTPAPTAAPTPAPTSAPAPTPAPTAGDVNTCGATGILRGFVNRQKMKRDGHSVYASTSCACGPACYAENYSVWMFDTKRASEGDEVNCYCYHDEEIKKVGYRPNSNKKWIVGKSANSSVRVTTRQ